MAQIKPMLLEETYDKSILRDDSKWFQIKENGTRGIIHVLDGKIVGIRNRSNLPIFYLFPELKDITLPFKSAILDGELCVFKNGKSVFYSGIDQRRSVPDTNTLKENPVTLVLFDALKVNDDILIMKPYRERYEKLLHITATDKIKVASNWYNGLELWDKVTKENQEGVVIKNPSAPYELDTRSKNYIKIKNYKLLDIVVEKTEQNSKGTKVFGKTNIENKEMIVEVQLSGVFDVSIGTTQTIKYLDICGNRLIQPTKVNREQNGGINVKT
jgi:bifunctional non-homologous end joining protein LigD